jgi:type IV secretion system protein VirD4
MKGLWAFGCRAVLLLAGGIFTFSAAMLGVQFPAVGWMALLAATWRLCRRGWPVTGAYGLLGEKGLILGRFFMASPSKRDAVAGLLSPFVKSEQACRQFYAAFLGSRCGGNPFIRTKDFVHLLTVAPAGGGKSTGVLVPNLLAYRGNCVVVDPKGELFAATADHRRKAFGHKIVRLDPASLMGPGADRFNPFDRIDPNAMDFIDKCRDLANMMVVRTGMEHEPHWLDSAENMICAFIAYICACEGNPDARNLWNMRDQLASRTNYTDALAIMQQDERFNGVVQGLGHSLTWHVDKELSSVMSHTMRHTNIFMSPLVEDSTGSTSFDPRELRSGHVTVYIIVPGDRLVVWAALLRLWLGCLLRIVTQGVPTEKNPVLFMIDEAAHIGRMQALEDAVTLLRGSGIRLWLFFQSLDQLNKCFGDRASTVLDNLATQQYFAINSYETAEAISKRIGVETIAIRTEGGNTGLSWAIGGDSKAGGNRSTGTSVTITETGRRWLMPEEVLVLPENVSLVFHKNNPVIIADLIKYYSDKAFRRRWWRGYGTGRSPGLGLGGMVLALAALLLAGVFACFVASLSLPRRMPGVPGGQRPGAGFSNPGQPGHFTVEPWRQPAPYRPDGLYPLPYREQESYP